MSGQDQRTLTATLSAMEDFHCERDIENDITNTMKEKHLVVEPLGCEDPVSPHYYRAQKYPPICAWCSSPLSEKNQKKFKDELNNSEGVIAIG